jgi:ATP-dependent helicase/nuclease subunit B
MDGIDKIVASGSIAAFSYPDEHPVVALWARPKVGFLARLQAAMQAHGAHPARTLVLLPYAQLRPVAARLWAQCIGDGFSPQFETTMNWCADRFTHVPSPTDLRLEHAWDILTAQNLLVQAGLAEHQASLASRLVETAHQLAPLAAACAPAARAQWAQRAREASVLGMSDGTLAWEIAVARIAVEWAAISGYASDVLFDPALCHDVDCLVMVRGIVDDPLAEGLKQVWQERLLVLPLSLANATLDSPATQDPVRLHACGDAEDEAQRCAAQALVHVERGRFPVALVSSDRALTRRVRALLDGAGVAIRDENGWKLSTSHCAATLMALLQACAWNASSDQVLNWLKATGKDFVADVEGLESDLRQERLRDWRHIAGLPRVQKNASRLATVMAINDLRDGSKGMRTLAQWLGWLRGALVACGLWNLLEAQGAGQQILTTLRLSSEMDPTAPGLLSDSLWSQRRLDLAEFSQWINETLESESYKPPYPDQEQLVILPMSQMLGRPFAAVVMAGCDAVRLPSAPEPPGHWTAAQRLALGLPTREALQTQVQSAWHSALQTPVRDVFWRSGDETGEVLLPSPLVQLLQLSHTPCAAAADPRVRRTVLVAATASPLPTGDLLPVPYLTQGAYDDLRLCPYRFFAMRQLGLKQVDELESEVEKRDFGVWLHAVLQHFHLSLAQHGSMSSWQRRVLLEESCLAITHSMGLPEGEFLPFAASWPAIAEGYLDWLQTHEGKESAVYQNGEIDQVQQLGTLKIRGRIDRIDRLPDGSVMVLDYKTEDSAKTKARAKDPLEDTQMAFYAALLPDDTLRGGYINIAEKKTEYIEQHQIVQARDALIEGMLGDLQRIAEGVVLPALGQASACAYCQARGLCRKDFWT